MLEIEHLQETAEPRYRVVYFAPGYSRPLIVANSLSAEEVLEFIKLVAQELAEGGGAYVA